MLRRLTAAVLAVVLAAAPARAQPVTIGMLLDRATRYVDQFVERFSNVVAEETYTQTVLLMGQQRGGGPSHRELKADFLLVRSPGSGEWMPFRDVFEVDRKPVRDREQRLARLFLEQTSAAMLQAKQIADESSRYNIGSMLRTVNNPVLALAFLQADFRQRFDFSFAKADASAGAGVTVVAYRERVRPTIIRGAQNSDVPVHGRFWIQADTGRIVKTELAASEPRLQANVTTTFRVDDRFNIDVPEGFREDYQLPTSHVTGAATYGRFRRFDVIADETMKKPTRTITEPRTGMTLVELEPGTFLMGSPPGEAGRNADEVSHEVTIGQPFYIGRYEVTQDEWRKVMGANPSHAATCGGQCPVENVSFADVTAFLAKLNAGAAGGVRYRLPTEAEWEYACRAGTTTPFAFGVNATTDQANYNGGFPYASFPKGEFRQKPTPIGTFLSNAWGLSDMHGNVWEWTADWYGPYAAGSLVDPRGPATGEKRVIRGGSWYFDGNSARCALRYTHAPEDKGFSLGLRLAADRPGR